MKAIFPRTGTGIAACVGVVAIVLMLLVNAALAHAGVPAGSKTRLVALLVLLLFRIATVFAVMAWTVTITKKAHALGHRGLPISPRAALGYWFVPFVNIRHGYRVVEQAWLASDPADVGKRGKKDLDEDAVPSILAVWWAGCLLARSVSLLAEMFWPEAADATILVEAAAAVLMFVVLRRVDDRQAAALAAYARLPSRQAGGAVPAST